MMRSCDKPTSGHCKTLWLNILVLCFSATHIASVSMDWIPLECKRCKGHPRRILHAVFHKDLQVCSITWTNTIAFDWRIRHQPFIPLGLEELTDCFIYIYNLYFINFPIYNTDYGIINLFGLGTKP